VQEVFVPTTFNVISLGQLSDIDTFEGNTQAENAAALVGLTFGGEGDALVNDFVTLSPVGDPGSYYDQDNSPAESFSIDGGPAQTFDATSVYSATVTYTDGNTSTISAVLMQDVDGNTYLAPEFSNNADQAALEADPIRSITLDSLIGNNYSGTTADRQSWDFVTCFTRGTEITTQTGNRPIEEIMVGDLVLTRDRGFQPVRWTGSRSVAAVGNFAPVLIRKDALGNTQDLRVSQQHRMLLRGWQAEMVMGEPEILIPARHLVNDDTITIETGGQVEYFHLLLDQHELVYASGIASESFHPGATSWTTLDEETRAEIIALFPELETDGPKAYGRSARRTARRHEAALLLSHSL